MQCFEALLPGTQMKEFFQMHKSEVYNVFSWQMILNIVQKAQSCKKTKKQKKQKQKLQRKNLRGTFTWKYVMMPKRSHGKKWSF